MKIEINLSQYKYEKKLVNVLFYAFIAGLMAIMVFYNYNLIRYYDIQLADVDKRNVDLNIELEKGTQIINEKGLSKKDSNVLNKKINYINTLVEKRAFSWTELIYNLEESTPDEISITEITPSFAENNIKIIGLAKNIDDIVKFVNNLQLSSYFKDAFLLEHNNVEIEKNNLIGFVITSRYIKK